jgi:hypothetical protein
MAELLDEEEARTLQNGLQTDPQLRRLYLHYMSLDVALEGHANSSASMKEILSSPHRHESRRWASWLSWRPLTAAAAGLVIGLFCASVVFAYVASSLGKVVTFLDDSFESGPAPLVTGAPMEAGHWSGNHTEVVSEQQGVKPESGKKMLRFLRTDYKRKPNPEKGHVGDIYQLIDMRPYRQEFADGGAVVQLSAGFNTLEFPADERYECSLTLYARRRVGGERFYAQRHQVR